MSSEWYVFGFATRYGPKIAIRMRMTMTMPPPIATLSLRSRLHAIWPRDRPSMALSDADNASSGAGPPGPLATSMGTAIVKPTCNPDLGRPRMVHPRVSPKTAVAPPVCSEVASFPAQVPDPRGTRSLIVTKVAPFCHSVLRSSPLMIKLLQRSVILLWLKCLFVGFDRHRTPNRLANGRERKNFGSGDAVTTQDIRDVTEIIVVGVTGLGRGFGRARGRPGGGRAGRQLPAARRILAQRPGGAGPGLGGLLVLVPADSAPAQRAGYHEQHDGQAGQRDPRPHPRREREALREVPDRDAHLPEHLDRAGQVGSDRQQRPGGPAQAGTETAPPVGEVAQHQAEPGQSAAQRQPGDLVVGGHARTSPWLTSESRSYPAWRALGLTPQRGPRGARGALGGRP